VFRFLSALLLSTAILETSQAGDCNRLTYLSETNPFYVSRKFPKLTTPQWVGEPGVETVVILAIDDMRDPDKYEKFLRPILRRLKEIDGRAPLSIMTNQVKPEHPQLQQWLKEGLSLEVHTIDHPCPFFAKGDFKKAKSTYDRCVDLMNQIPGNKPVAFRMPCCDSLNTVSPRFFGGIFDTRTTGNNFLEIDSSVFNVLTSSDPDLPRDLVIDADGQDKFQKYLSCHRSFVNTVENYPYPYVINKVCWEFPCVVPSDWEANDYHKPNNPITVRDREAALDAVVLKQGVFTMVFHPHGWIKNDQIVELIDYAASKHGSKVKFLTFRDALERLNKNLLLGQPLRKPDGGEDNRVRLLDVNNDGYLDVIICNQACKKTRVWSLKTGAWIDGAFPEVPSSVGLGDRGGLFGVMRPDSNASFLYQSTERGTGWHWSGEGWEEDKELVAGLEIDQHPVLTLDQTGNDRGVRLRDLDRDGRCELIAREGIFTWSASQKRWSKLPFTLPPGATVVDKDGRDRGLRFVDVNQDGCDDVIFSNQDEYGLYLYTSMDEGWGRKVLSGKRGDQAALPLISANSADSGFFVHANGLWWCNENTDLLKDLVDRRSFQELLAPVEPQARSAEASLRSWQCRPGFEIELVAAEPLVESPIYVSWGPDGKLWVVEMGDYPQGIDGKGKPGGRIKYLEDTKGTGKYDKATVFLEGVNFPTSVMPWGKGVIVTAAPEIFYAEDTDGDGKADVRRTLYTGLVEGNPQHRVNSLVWGLDNWIYCANGESGGQVKSVKTGAVVDIRGRDFRIRPDEGLIEAQTGQTQYGRCRDDWGNWFGCNNSDPMYHFVLDDHYLRRNPYISAPQTRVQVSVTPGAAPVYPISRTLPRFNDLWAANHFTSACSVMVYRDELFGPDFQGNCLVSEPVHDLVHREIMTPKGVTFTSHRANDEQHSEFLASSDNWTRPTTIQTGPDGALWVVDMYRQVIEHPEWIPKEWQKKLDLRAGSNMGRIYRVHPTGKRPRAIPRLDRLDGPGLVAALDSPNGWQRDTAQQMLIRRHDTAAIPLLEQSVKENPRPLCRLQALCTLDGLAALKPEILRLALNDKHPGIRRHAIRLCESHLSAELGGDLVRLVADPDPQVRMQLAYTLGEWKDPRAGEALGKLALRDADDPFILAAVMSSANSQNLDSLLLTILASAKTTAPSAELTENLLRLASNMGSSKTLAIVLDKVATPDQGHYASWQFTALAGLLDALDQKNTTLAKLQGEGEAELKSAIGKLGGMFADARALASSSQASTAEKLQAVRLLGRGLTERAQDRELLVGLLVPQTEQEVQVAVVVSLGRMADPATAELLVRGWKGYGPALRSQVLDVFLQRGDWLTHLLNALEQKQILSFEIDAARRQRLLAHRNQAVRERAVKLFAGSVDPDREKVVEAFASALTLKGDSQRGTAVFTKTCSPCHRVAGIGHEVGPDLASIGDKSPPSLLVAILDPNRAVEARYVNYMALTKNGLTFTGVLASETGNSVTLIGPEGKRQTILRNDLEQLVSSNKSVMPEGLERDLKAQDLADLIAFIRADIPLPQRRTFEGNTPALIRPDADGSLHLLAKNGEIYGSNVVFEEKYGNLGFWRSEDDKVVWSIDIAKPGKYAVWLDWACDDKSAGNEWVLQAEIARLTGRVKGTGTWDDYRQAKVGEIHLRAGRQQVTVHSAGRIHGVLIDLRGVKFVPVATK
jgi:putative membrane-bound dehydrogenase-like protein